MKSAVRASLFQPVGGATAGYQHYAFAPGPHTFAGRVLAGQPRVKRVLFELPDTLEPAYYAEVQSTLPGSLSTDATAYVISAKSGRVLFRKNLVAEDTVYKFKVWADPSGKFIPWDSPQGTTPTPSSQTPTTTFEPAFVTPNLISLQNSSFSKNDPWLPSGATETVGNNVDAYVDLAAPDGRSGADFRASITGNDASHTFNPALDPTSPEQRQAAISTLFYATNFFHDWYYDVGFDEASGNAQTNNFGRGGVEGDVLLAEAQDYGGVNNANMFTPADGEHPRMQMYRFTPATPDRDGDLDMTVVGHEWGHYISGRLIGDGNGLDTNTANGMGEGWADFHALLLTTRAEDLAVPKNANWAGAFPMGVYAVGGIGDSTAYFGIRRAPYSVDFTKNGLTYKHIVPGNALGAGFPTAFGADGADNGEVHNIGEVWASMLWECYVTLLRDPRYSFQQAQDRMKAYLVAAYKLTPSSPTFLDARDAVLLAAFSTNAQDFTQFAQAFARRGLGTGAVAGTDVAEVGLLESFTVGADLAVQSVTVEEKDWCDNDGIIDANETGRVTVKVKNVGVSALAQAQVTVTSDNANVVLANGGKATFALIPPYSVGTATVDVTLKPITVAQSAGFTVVVTDMELAKPRAFTHLVVTEVNADAIPQSTQDTFDEPALVWTNSNVLSDAGTATRFSRIDGNGGGLLHAPDPGFASDQVLVSPPLELTGPLQFTFDHRHQFEADGTGAYDGARVEATVNDGATWNDLGPSMTPGYKGSISTYAQDQNPLAGQSAFVSGSIGYPAFLTEHVSAAGIYSGKTVQVRFRVASDGAAGAKGWDIDNVAFTGLKNGPFPAFIANRALCVNHPPVLTMPAKSSVHEGQPVTLSATATDVDNPTLTSTWTELSGPNVKLSGANTLNLKFTAPTTQGSGSTLVFKLVVSDGTLAVEGTVEVNVTADHPPVAKITGPLSGNAGEAVTLSGSSATDPDGDLLAFAWEQTAGAVSKNTGGTTSTFKATLPTAAKVGDVLIYQLTVTDPAGVSSTVTARVTVSAGSGCGCSTGATAPDAAAALLLLLLLGRRRARG